MPDQRCAAVTASYRFGPVHIDPSARSLRVDDREIALGRRAFDVLLALVERCDRVVTKEELLALAWPGLVVEENNLQVQISTLRRVLGHGAIATVAGRGYRFALALESAPSGSGASASTSGLPESFASFVGRGKEIAELSALVQRHRLVTLIGVGGIGKTRLALQLARLVRERYPDGAWFVDLAPLNDPPLVPQAVAAVLGVPQDSNRSVGESLSAHVAGRTLLIVLDNCEHLAVTCADIARFVLEASPRSNIVATSREPLHVVGESTYQVSPLEAPDPRHAKSPDEVAAFDAARLFIDRAEAARPGFVVTPRNAEHIATICRDLDGIPLALELAAARVRSMQVETIATRLGDRFRLLKGGDPSAMPRQHTLRAAIDWSYDLLDDAMRALLISLSVFAGGFTVEGAEAVGAGPEVDAADVLDLLGDLTDKSLVSLDTTSGRYRLLETVRQYALERLAAADGERAARDRHLAFYVALAKQAEPRLFGPEQPAWYARLDNERENVLAALAHYRNARGKDDAGLAMLRPLRRYLGRGQLELWHRVVTEALASPAAQAETLARAGALQVASYLAYLRGRYEESCALAEASLHGALAHGDDAMTLDARNVLGYALLGLAEFERARANLFESLALARTMSDSTRMADALTGIAESYAARGEFQAAHPHYAEALEQYRAKGESDYIGLALGNLARNSVSRRDAASAVACMSEFVTVVGAAPSVQNVAGVLEVLAGIAELRGELSTAARFAGAQERHHAQTGLVLEAADAAFVAAVAGKVRERLGEEAFAAACAEGRAMDGEVAFAEAIAWLEAISRRDRAATT